MNPQIERALAEQCVSRDWLRNNGHDTDESILARLGASDWVMEGVNKYSHGVWQRYASPVWMDIRQGDTLQRESARAEKDDRHICPLQLQVIERCIELWTNENDLILDPFAGIGSTAYVAMKMKRRSMSFELKRSYFDQICANLRGLEKEG